MSDSPADRAVEARLLERAPSVCGRCGQRADASILERDGQIYQRTDCSCHAPFEDLLFSDARFYHQLDGWNQRIFDPAGCPDGVDRDGKPPVLAVIDLTNRCNLQCPLCFAEASSFQPPYFLDVKTVRAMLEALLNRGEPPCRHIQFSGGEPTLHPDFVEIVALAREMGFTHVQVATNGTRFLDDTFLDRASRAGLHTLYLQFDGMDDRVYLALRGRPLLDGKVATVRNIEMTSMRVVLVPTIVPGVNVDQIGPIFRFAVEHSRHITGISIQPMARVGRLDVNQDHPASFNLADMAMEFGTQTGLTRFPDDWFPLSAVSLLTRGVSKLRGERLQDPACDAHCSIGSYFLVDDRGQPTCINQFLDVRGFLEKAGHLRNGRGGGWLRQPISQLRQFNELSSCFDRSKAPPGFTFQRLLRGLDGWEDKSLGRGSDWFRRGFDGMFVAGMHFMDAGNYSLRRLGRCIIKYVTTSGEVVSFCRYNAGERFRTAEELTRIGGAAVRVHAAPSGAGP